MPEQRTIPVRRSSQPFLPVVLLSVIVTAALSAFAAGLALI